MSLTYARPSDRVGGTWSIATGTPRAGRGVANLGNGDPADPCWITGTSIDVSCAIASQRIDGVVIVGHTFTPSCGLHVHVGSLDIPVTVPAPYMDGTAYNLFVDVKALYPTAGDRIASSVRLVNTSTNGATIAIGEVWILSTTRTLSRGIRYGFIQGRERLTASQQSAQGVQTVYDFGATARTLRAEFPARDQDFDDLRALEDDARGAARMFPIVPAPSSVKARFAEPMLVRLATSLTAAPFQHPALIPVSAEFAEQGCGALLGA